MENQNAENKHAENPAEKKKKSNAMRALTLSLVAASALVLTVIVIAFSGASNTANDPGKAPAVTTEHGNVSLPAADLGYNTPESTAEPSVSDTADAHTDAQTTEARTPETTAAPVYALAFTSNGDGTCYVSGLGTYQNAEVSIPTLSPNGDVVTGIGKYAFYNKASIVRISIPSTIRMIGEYAFFGCSSLIEITVSASNTAYKVIDGLLYSYDGSRLILCPAMRGKSTCVLGKDVTVIERGAFSGVASIRTVYYKGTPMQWTSIQIGANNEVLDGVQLVCNYVN